VLRVDTVTLTGFAPGQPFSITEVFDFTQDRGTFPFAPQGNVGATIMTDPVCRCLYRARSPVLACPA
jgi:hypothetical protein